MADNRRITSAVDAGKHVAGDINDAYASANQSNSKFAAEIMNERVGQSTKLFANKPEQEKQFAESVMTNTSHLPEIELSMMTMRHKKELSSRSVLDLSEVAQEGKTTDNSIFRRAAVDTLKDFEGDRRVQIIGSHKVISVDAVERKVEGLKKNDNLELEYDRLVAAKSILFKPAEHNKGDLFAYMAKQDGDKTSLTRQELKHYLAKAELFEDWQTEKRLGNKETHCPVSRREMAFFSPDRLRAAEEIDRLWESPGGALHGMRTNADGYRTLKRGSLEALNPSSYSGLIDRYDPFYDREMRGQALPKSHNVEPKQSEPTHSEHNKSFAPNHTTGGGTVTERQTDNRYPEAIPANKHKGYLGVPGRSLPG